MDRRGFSFLQDLLCVTVAMVATCLLMVGMASLHAASVEQDRQRQLAVDAWKLCDGIIGYDGVLHDGKRGLFDPERLNSTDAAGIRVGLRIVGGFRITILAVGDHQVARASWNWSSGLPKGDTGACVTSATVQLNEGEVVSVRVLVTIWRD